MRQTQTVSFHCNFFLDLLIFFLKALVLEEEDGGEEEKVDAGELRLVKIANLCGNFRLINPP